MLQLTGYWIATYNVLNLDPVVETGVSANNIDDDLGDGRFAAIGSQIATNLNAPDIICLQEIQDNDGAQNNGLIAADVTLQTLVTAIANAGGPTYTAIDNPAVINGAGGGQPGGNIRTAYLYNRSGCNWWSIRWDLSMCLETLSLPPSTSSTLVRRWWLNSPLMAKAS
ncbi:MAG: hypothetical protein HC818_01110 [Synechococcaceae cyanobacterium RM1_1_27]|nr:hypothetical protein [Synechococcaceae cyanobacterium RM1_1_27]